MNDPGVRTRNIAIAAVLIVGALLVVGFWQKDALFGPSEPVLPTDPLPLGSVPPGERPMPPVAAGDPSAGDLSSMDLLGDPPGVAEQRWADALGQPPAWPADLASPSCSEVEREVEALCRTLDDRSDLRVAGEGSPCDFLMEAARELARRPPAVSAELRSHAAMLGNVYHLFRVLGRERLGLLRDLVREEGELAEPAAFVIYRWWMSRDSCTEESDEPIGVESFYDYAGYTFQSVGGQAYMRRRSPRLEALTCFYGLHGLDVAISGGHNPDGIDLLPELERCRLLVATQPLLLARHYSDELERIAARWRAKRPS